MPFKIEKKNNYYKLRKVTDNKLVNVKFKSKENAINQAKNYMRYRGEIPIVKGNKVLNKNTI